MFPKLNKINQWDAGHDDQNSFLTNLLEDHMAPAELLVLQRTTASQVRAFEGDNLVRCFPLQFPYGIGGKPEKMELLEYLRHLVQISIPSFQTPKFLLVVHNLAAKCAAVRTAVIRCKYKANANERQMMADLMAEVTEADIKKHLDDARAEKTVCGTVGTRKLIGTVQALSLIHI